MNISNTTIMSNTSTTIPSIVSTMLTTTTTTTLPLSSTRLMLTNDTIYNILKNYFNLSNYQHQVADLLEPEKTPIPGIHAMIWIVTILTYLIAIPLVVRMVRTKFYQNLIDYFSFHIIICAFIAWIPTMIFLFYYWSKLLTLKLCRLHYAILSTNETVPLFFVLYMVIERFFYAHPALKHRFVRFSQMSFIHFYAIFTWLLIMLSYSLASPFDQRDLKYQILNMTVKYCPYNYEKLNRIATARSIIYFILLIPATILILCVLRYFYLMRGTNQVPTIQKLWTIRVTTLLSILVFYDIYLYYLEHITETFRSFLLASLLRSTFYIVQILVILLTEPYWIEFIYERCLCLCCSCFGQRRKPMTPSVIPIETEITTFPFSETGGHYSLVDDNVVDEFDLPNNRSEPALRVIV